MARLRPLDRAILSVLGPLWLVCFLLHSHNALVGRLVEPSVYVAAAEQAGGPPVIRSFRRGSPAERSGLAVGDRLLRIGQRDLAGAGALGFFAAAMAAVGRDGQAPLQIERGGETLLRTLRFTPLPLPFRFHLLALGFAACAVLILLRAPRSPAAGGAFRALLLFSFVFFRGWGGPPAQTYGWLAITGVLSVFVCPVVIFAARSVRDTPLAARGWSRIWPWALAPAGPLFVMGVVGIPILGAAGNLADTLAILLLGVVVLVVLATATRSYQHSGPLGRRRIKWVVLGFYVSLAPILLAMAVSVWQPELWWLSDAAEVFEIGIPISIFLAIVRFNLFDIDRLISAAASYSAVMALAALGVLLLVPDLARAASDELGLDPFSARVGLGALLVGLALPAQRLLGPRLDAWMFPERQALAEGIQAVLAELGEIGEPSALAEHASRRVADLIRPEHWVTFARSDDGFGPVFVRGATAATAFDAGHPVIAVLERRHKPLAAEAWARTPVADQQDAFEQAALASLDAAVLLPIHSRGRLVAFSALGPKSSGDVYTVTDLALLAAVANRMSSELERFGDALQLRESQAMARSLRQYVPGAVAEALDTRRDIRSGRSEVSVLFVDIRGYTRFAQDRAPDEIFATINRYTEAVSQAVRAHRGAIVEFNGDGMMAVFGAPEPLPGKERAAVDAGRAILTAVAALRLAGPDGPLAAGVGIATGEAFVGNIRAVDRFIWSAIGTTTNRAARLEALTRDLDAAMVIDSATRDGASDAALDFAQRCGVAIKGLAEPIDVYALPAPT